MKSLPRSTNIYQQVDAVRLYRDDLERVVGLLGDAGFSITIADGSFEYESFDELQKAQGKSPQNLKIEAIDPSSRHRIELSKSGRFWYIHSSGKEYYGLAREIEALVIARQSAVERLPLHWMFQCANLLLWIGLAIRTKSSPASFTLMAMGATALVCTLGLSVYWLLHPGVVLNYKHEVGFFARNRDAIILLLCGAIIGAIVQYLSSLLAGTSAPTVAA